MAMHDSNSPDQSSSGVPYVFGVFAVVAAGVAASVIAEDREINEWTIGSSLAAILFGVVAGTWVRTIRPKLLEARPNFVDGLESLAVSPRTWLMLFLIPLTFSAVYVAATSQRIDKLEEVAANLDQYINRDMALFRRSMERWVMPRCLTGQQIEALSRVLTDVSPDGWTIVIAVEQYDDEAWAFSRQIAEALTKARWPHENMRAELDTGLRIQERITDETRERLRANPQEIPMREVVRNALRTSGVMQNGMGSGTARILEIGDRTFDANVLAILVGPRLQGPDGDPNACIRG